MLRLGPLALSCAALLLAAARPAAANGRPPATRDIHFRQGHPEDIAVGLTFGLLRSHDGGKTWRDWVCEKVVHYGGQYDPTYAYSASGALFATSFDGLLVSRGGCTFEPTALGKLFVSTLELASDGTLYVAVSDPLEAKIHKSTDDGATLPAASDPGLPGDWWQSLASAPSRPGRLYLAGYRIPGAGLPRVNLLFRSDDGAATFAPLPVGGFVVSSLSILSIAAVSPTNPDLVFLRVSYQNGVIGDAIYRSADAGASWSKVLEVGDAIGGFVVRQDGTVLAGTRTAGTFVSHDQGQTFAPVTPSLQVECLVETPDGGQVWACAQNYAPDNMGIAASPDGVAWTKVLRYQEIQGPQACAAGTDQKDFCEAMIWCGLAAQLGVTATPVACAMPSEGPAVEAMPDSGAKPPTKPGCCDAGPATPGGALLAAGSGLALLRPRRGWPRRAARRSLSG